MARRWNGSSSRVLYYLMRVKLVGLSRRAPGLTHAGRPNETDTHWVMSDDRYFVEVQHRPRRVAFLVDVDQCPDTLFDEIVDFNVSSWGGRYNPVIPILSGQITEAYWRLLNLINPDILYTYCDLPTALVKRILTELRPLDVIKHVPLHSGSDRFRVRIDRQATVIPLLSRITEQVPVFVRRPEVTVLVFEHKDIHGLSSFVRRNFGGNSDLYLWCRNRGIPFFTLPPDDKEVMKALVGNRNIVLPINVCADAPRKFKASTGEWGTALTLCFGTSPWNFVEYWNLVHFQGEASSMMKSLSEMWLPPALLEDKSFYEAFLELLRRRSFVSQQQSNLRLISYDESEERMREVTKQICADFKWNMYPSEPIVREKGELPTFKTQRVISFSQSWSSRPRQEQVSGNRSFLELNPPDYALRDRDERWIAEFALENPQQERYFANKAAWWKLPKKHRVAGLFVPESACRVGSDHLICAEVSGQQQGVLLNTPELAALFETLVLPGAAPEWARRFDPAMGDDPGRTFYIRSSDKGKYARGVLGLFESLQKAAYVFEHDFWRAVIESLSSPVASEQTRNKVRKDLERIENDALQTASGRELVVGEVLHAAGRIQRPIHYTKFESLFRDYWTYVKGLPPEEQFFEVSQTDYRRSGLADEKDFRNGAHTNLRRMLSEMTARTLFLHGAEVQCDHCLASLWYHVDDLRSVVTCRGCRRDVSLPAEIPWSYALNELVVSAVRDHGVAPVIRTAFHLFKDSRECFCFLPGIEIRDYDSDPEAQVCELDLVWIRDGEFGIAEVKRNPKKFSIAKKFAKILDASLPDRFLLVSTSGTNDEMQEVRSELQPLINSNITIDAWNPDIFTHSSHSGWNISTHSIFP